jgi:hypothetical protein
MTTKTADDLEAVRSLVDTLQPFASDDRERIVRWAREKLGMTPSSSATPTASVRVPGVSLAEAGQSHPSVGAGATDIRTFVAERAPRSDTHFAATVAYYYQFRAPEALRKPSIGKDDLIDACRKVDRKRPAKPAQVLVNAYHEGILDRAEKGQYKLNSVGENLVAMVLPGGSNGKQGKASARTRRTKKARRSLTRKQGKR